MKCVQIERATRGRARAPLDGQADAVESRYRLTCFPVCLLSLTRSREPTWSAIKLTLMASINRYPFHVESIRDIDGLSLVESIC